MSGITWWIWPYKQRVTDAGIAFLALWCGNTIWSRIFGSKQSGDVYKIKNLSGNTAFWWSKTLYRYCLGYQEEWGWRQTNPWLRNSTFNSTIPLKRIETLRTHSGIHHGTPPQNGSGKFALFNGMVKLNVESRNHGFVCHRYSALCRETSLPAEWIDIRLIIKLFKELTKNGSKEILGLNW